MYKNCRNALIGLDPVRCSSVLDRIGKSESETNCECASIKTSRTQQKFTTLEDVRTGLAFRMFVSNSRR